MKVFISDIIVKKDYFWIIGQLESGIEVFIRDIYYDLQEYIGQYVEMLLSFMRSPSLEQKCGIHNKAFLSENFYSLELIDELIKKGKAHTSNDRRTVILKGEYIKNYTILESWNPLIQRTSFKALFRNPSALKTEDGTYLLYPFHSRSRSSTEGIFQEVIMAGSLRLEAWHSIQ